MVDQRENRIFLVAVVQRSYSACAVGNCRLSLTVSSADRLRRRADLGNYRAHVSL